jgi:DinB superfamily
MQYMRLSRVEQGELMRSLAGMAAYLESAFATLTPQESREPGPDGAFSPVEQVWHLADLERAGFGVRIRRLQTEHAPHLPDFDGARVARERDYRSRSLREGLQEFTSARDANIAILESLSAQAWARGGTQEGVGAVSLCDMPAFLLQHDQAHKAEIEAWKRHFGRCT